MVILYLTSSTAGAGKTGVVAGIGRRLLSQNKKVGYLRPSLMADRTRANEDSAIMQRFVRLQESQDVLSPVFADSESLKSGLKDALGRVSAGKDAVVIEETSGQAQTALDAAVSLGAKIVGVEVFSRDFQDSTSYYKGMGRNLAGVVLNKVPPARVAVAQADFTEQARGIKLLGVIPEERSLSAMSVAELAQDVHGSIVSGVDKSSSVVQNIMLGAMNPDHGPEYYSIKENKAVIVRSDRPDMQLAALETPTTCLVLAGQEPLIQMVLRRAEAQSVPIVSTKEDVKSVVADIEAALTVARLDDRRIAALAELADKTIDFAAIL